MKKLLFVATAALCATVFGAIESTNVVGYQGLQANATRNTMIAPTFLGIGDATGCKLSDLKVVGYDSAVWTEVDDDEWEWVGGCRYGNFIVNFLQNNGTAAASYYWIDDGETGPAWCDKFGTPIDATQVAIKAGVAMWIKGSGMKLQAAGAVNKADVAYVLNATRQTAVGNNTPVALTLADLTVTGYTAAEYTEVDDDEWEWVGGCRYGNFIVNFLLNTGVAEASYYWIDDGETGPAWCDKSGNPIDATQVSIPAGKGMWVKGSGMTLNIPAPEGL